MANLTLHPCAQTGRKQLVIEVAPLDADSEEELEDIETPEHARQLRWQRVVQAAVKQSLRRARLRPPLPSLPPAPRTPCSM